MKPDFTIYTLPDCPWCVKAKQLLTLFNFTYEEINEKSPDFATVPYIVKGETPIGGFTELAAYCRTLKFQ